MHSGSNKQALPSDVQLPIAGSVVSWPRSCDLERGCTTTRVPYESDYKLHNETFSVAILSRYKIVSIDDIAMSVTLWLPAPIRQHAVVYNQQFAFRPYMLEHWPEIQKRIDEVLRNPEPGHTPALEVREWRSGVRIIPEDDPVVIVVVVVVVVVDVTVVLVR